MALYGISPKILYYICEHFVILFVALAKYFVVLEPDSMLVPCRISKQKMHIDDVIRDNS